MRRLLAAVLLGGLVAVIVIDAVWVSHGGDEGFPGRHALVGLAAVVVLVVLAKVLLPPLLSKPEDQDEW